jgi:hypothetical protein
VLGAAGSVFVANYENSPLNGGAIGNTLINFSMGKNAIAWQVHGVYPSTPAYADGILYVANEDPLRLEVRSEADGALLWWWTPPLADDLNFSSEVLLTKNLVFVSTNLATYAIDVTTHRAVWSYPLSGRLELSAVGPTGLVAERDPLHAGQGCANCNQFEIAMVVTHQVTPAYCTPMFVAIYVIGFREKKGAGAIFEEALYDAPQWKQNVNTSPARPSCIPQVFHNQLEKTS